MKDLTKVSTFFRGMERYSDPQMTKDGGMEDLINLSVGKDGSLRPMGNLSIAINLGEGVVPLYIHVLPDGQEILIVQVFNILTVSHINKNGYWQEVTGKKILNSSISDDTLSFFSLGNVLIVSNRETCQSDYFLFQNGRYIKQLIPETPTLSVEEEKKAIIIQQDAVSLEKILGEFFYDLAKNWYERNVGSIEKIPMHKQKEVITKKYKDHLKKVGWDAVDNCVKKADLTDLLGITKLKVCTDTDYLYEYVLFIAVIRLFDGTYIRPSVIKEAGLNDENNIMELKPNGVHMNVYSLDLTASLNTQGYSEEQLQLIDAVEVYAFKHDPYKQPSLRKRNEDGTIKNPIRKIFVEGGKDLLEKANAFYYIGRATVRENFTFHLSSTGKKKKFLTDFTVGNPLFENMDLFLQQPTLDWGKLIPNISIVGDSCLFNNRRHLYNIKECFDGSALATQNREDGVGSYIKLREGYYNCGKVLLESDYLYSPIPSVEGIGLWNRYYKLQQHKYLSISYFVNKPNNFDVAETPHLNKTRERNNVLKITEIDNPLGFTNALTYSFSGDIRGCCIANNSSPEYQYGHYPLYVFTSRGIVAMEQGEGSVVYARKSYINQDVILGTTCFVNTPYGICYVANGTICLLNGSRKELSTSLESLRDLRMIEDPTIAKLYAMYGDGADIIPFSQFLKDVQLGYNARRSELYLYNDIQGLRTDVSYSTAPYIYVYSFHSQAWSKRIIPNRKEELITNEWGLSEPLCVQDISLITGGQNNYLFVNKLDESAILYTIDTGEGNADKVFMLTRPLTFGTNDFKRIEESILRTLSIPLDRTIVHENKIPTFQGEAISLEVGYSVFVLGSQDGMSWRVVGGVSNVPKVRDIRIPFNRSNAHKMYAFCLVGGIEGYSSLHYIESKVNSAFNNRFR